MDIGKFIEEGYKKERAIKITPPTIPLRRQYDEKIVAWIDVLGMRKRIRNFKEYDAEKILTVMERFQNYIRNSCEDIEGIKYIQISDGFILVTEFEYLKELCEILCEIQWKILINDNMILRGALTSGKIRITNDDPSLIVGPALVEAFEMESENAIFPRIIISHDLYQSSNFNFILEDSDHFYYLDFLDYVIKTENFNNKKLLHVLRTYNVIKFIKDEYNDNIIKNKRVAQKYGWLIAKLSSKQIKVL
jgi:hypothetical protein